VEARYHCHSERSEESHAKQLNMLSVRFFNPIKSIGFQNDTQGGFHIPPEADPSLTEKLSEDSKIIDKRIIKFTCIIVGI
jgi:hypothetical protein